MIELRVLVVVEAAVRQLHVETDDEEKRRRRE